LHAIHASWSFHLLRSVAGEVRQPHPDRVGGDVGDVQQRDLDRGLHLVGDPVHGVGAQHQQLGARALQGSRRVG
jgi:hypothetical protein